MFKKGFTLIELTVVISIISMLSGIVLTYLSEARAKARDSKRITDMKQLQTALAIYYHNHGAYPNPVPGTDEYYDSNTGCAAYQADQLFEAGLKPDLVTNDKVISQIPKAIDSFGCYSYIPPNNFNGILSCGTKIVQNTDYILNFNLEKTGANLAELFYGEEREPLNTKCLTP